MVIDELYRGAVEGVDASETKSPLVMQWNPPLNGDIDIRITHNGEWLHEGSPIQRRTLIKLFSSILKREENAYYLVTPVEKWRIQVDDVPFTVSGLKVGVENGQQALVFSTSVGDEVIAGPEHGLRLKKQNKGEEAIPYLQIRYGMEGRITRPVFYQLADIAQLEADSTNSKKAVHGVYSLGVFFPLE